MIFNIFLHEENGKIMEFQSTCNTEEFLPNVNKNFSGQRV